MPGYHSQDIGAVLNIVDVITLSQGNGLNGAADVNGTGIDRLTYKMPLSGKVVFSVNGTAADTAQLRIESSTDNTVWTALTDKAGTTYVIDLVAGTTDTATVDVDLAKAGQYIRGVVEADGTTAATTLSVVAFIVLGGAKENG